MVVLAVYACWSDWSPGGARVVVLPLVCRGIVEFRLPCLVLVVLCVGVLEVWLSDGPVVLL